MTRSRGSDEPSKAKGREVSPDGSSFSPETALRPPGRRWWVNGWRWDDGGIGVAHTQYGVSCEAARFIRHVEEGRPPLDFRKIGPAIATLAHCPPGLFDLEV